MAVRGGRTVRDLRRESRAAVLQRLYFDGPTSRQALGPATGLSSGSISTVVAELIADGLLEKAGSVGSDGGRPPTLLRVVPGSGQLTGVDVGENRVRVGLFATAPARPAARVRIELGSLGPDAVTVGAATPPLAAFLSRGGRRTPAVPPRPPPPAWRTALDGRLA